MLVNILTMIILFIFSSFFKLLDIYNKGVTSM